MNHALYAYNNNGGDHSKNMTYLDVYMPYQVQFFLHTVQKFAKYTTNKFSQLVVWALLSLFGENSIKKRRK